MSAVEDRKAIRNALSLINQRNSNKATAVPSSGPKAAIDYLSALTADTLPEDVNLRDLSDKLFNWGGVNRSTKTTTKALGKALSVPGHYPQAVELVGFLSALSPMLEPDRLVRLLALSENIDNAYAPTRYTLHFAKNLNALFGRYPAERVEKLAKSLWETSHTGRWWDLTMGEGAQATVAEADENANADTLAQVRQAFYNETPAYSVRNVATFSRQKPSEEMREFIEAFVKRMKRGETVNPDVALFISHLPWLTSDERPESPVESLIAYLLQTLKYLTQYKVPEKPKTFASIFPDIRLYTERAAFPYPAQVLQLDGTELCVDRGVPVIIEVVKNLAELAENRTYMGNCTWSFNGRMKKGSYLLLRLRRDGEVFNAGASYRSSNGGEWAFDQINSRFNRGGVPQLIQSSFKTLIRHLPTVPEETMRMLQRADEEAQRVVSRHYSYHL